MQSEKTEELHRGRQLVSKADLDLLIMRDMVGDILANAERMNLESVYERAMALDYSIAYALAAKGAED